MAGEHQISPSFYTEQKQREFTSALVQLFARCLHQVDLEHQGVRAPTKEQLERWSDKYMGIPDPEAGVPYMIKSNLLRARTDYLVACVHNLVHEMAEGKADFCERHDEFDRG